MHLFVKNTKQNRLNSKKQNKYKKIKSPTFKVEDFLFGACDGTRTCDLLITNELHYQLCYTSIFNLQVILYSIIKTFSSVFSAICIYI